MESTPRTPAEQARLAARLHRAQAGAAAAATIPRRPDPATAPLSFAQERLWFLDQWEPGTAVYNIARTFVLHGPLDRAALQAALDAVVARHAILRTTFPAPGGQPVQQIAAHPSPDSAVPLPLVDLGGEAATRWERVRRLAAEEAARPFDLQRGPLFRASLLRLADAEHVLLLTLHHIVADGWSLGILFRELAAAYAACAAEGPGGRGAGREEGLPPLPIQYGDFAAWQREWLAGPRLERQIEGWRERLAPEGTPPPALDLPTDWPRPAVQTYRGGQVDARLGAPVVAALRALGLAEGATLFMTLLAALQVLLHRLSGQADIVVGAPVAGRPRTETEGLIGFFINMLPLHARLDGDLSFRDVLRQVRAGALDAYAHQDVPFAALVAALQPERDLSHTPLFQVALNMLNLPGPKGHPPPELALPGLRVTPLARSEAGAKFDFTLYVAEQGGALQCDLVYNRDLFLPARMAELLAQYHHLLAQVVDHPDQLIGATSLVTPGARRGLPDPAAPLDAGWQGAVHTLFAAQARQTPDRPAVVDPLGAWTYGELDAWSNRLAHHLRAAGIAAPDIVAIYSHRSAALAWAVLGVLKAGAAFLLLDPSYPPPRLAALLRAAQPRGWIQIEAAGPLPPDLADALAAQDWGCRVVLPAIHEVAARDPVPGQPATDPAVPVGPDDLACVGFTSGTTGRPQGILGRHGPLTHFLPWLQESFGLGTADRFSLCSGLAHDPLQRDIFTPLCLGATLCIPASATIGAPGGLAAWMAQAGITVAHLTPALGQLLTVPPASPLPALRVAFFVGDVLTRQDVARLRALAPAATCVNYYGSTETQRAVGYFVVPDEGDTGPSAGSREIIPLGRGISDVQLLVLNAAGQLASIGELGAIAVRSPHLARGYLGDAALTAARFQANPWTHAPGDRLYHTGDLGRYLPDGTVAFAGRADGQVKIRGYRVEPGEIEATLGRYPAVREAVVVARDDPPGEKRLVAYIVLQPGPVPTAADLRRFIAAQLPAYMVPAAWVRLPALPLTANGKVDRQRLPPPTDSGLEPDAAIPHPPALTPVEEIVAGVWAAVLRREAVGVQDNFFDLGGHSLLATQVIARLGALFAIDLPVRRLFEAPTVAGLARVIAQELQAGASAPEPASASPLHRRPRAEPPLLSFAQQRLWFLEQLVPGRSDYNIALACRLSGELNLAALAAAITTIVRRHEAWRTTFAAPGGSPVQVIHPAEPVPLPLLDLQGVPAEVQDARVREAAQAAARQPFDLEHSPLLRVECLRLTATEHVLLLTVHHIVADAWSMGVFLRELAALYPAALPSPAGVPPGPDPLPPLPVQYADFAQWERAALAGPRLTALLDYWRQQLAGAPPTLELPTDYPRPGGLATPTAGEVHEFTLPPELSPALRALGRQEGCTLFMTLLAAFQVLLARTSGQTDIVVGTPSAGRTQPVLEPLLGLFVNTLALRTDLGGRPTFRALLGRVREVALGAYAHQDLPFDKLVEAVQPERDPGRTPIFQVFFTVQEAPLAARPMGGVILRPQRVPRPEVPFDLTLTLEDGPAGLRTTLAYNAGLFAAATMERLAGHFQTLLAAIEADPDQPISTLPLLTPGEQQQILVDWNRPAPADTPGGPDLREGCAHWWIAAQARRTPDAVAVRCDGHDLTYRELDRRANQLAHHLQTLGVGPEVPVGVYVERSLDLIVGLVGILKAGGVYLPLDPRLPPERIAFMLADARAAVVLTQAPLRGHLPEGTAALLCLDSEWPVVARQPATPPPDPAGPDHLAYIIYTSGSTGRPKGVALTHRNLGTLLWGMAPWDNLRPGDQVLQVVSPGFDAAVGEMGRALVAGATLVLPTGEAQYPGPDLLHFMRDEAITTAMLPPTMLGALPTAALPALRTLSSGGEALPAELVRRWGQQGRRFFQVYGPTEAAVWATAAWCASDPAPPPIGRPLAQVTVYVLDGQMQPLPAGGPGELYLGGTGLARGYVGRPDLTAAAFVPDPFGGTPGARLYRTGDLARWRRDGNLEFLGRRDHQVKIRSQRIELGEIETVLGQHPAVREAVVLAREDTPGDKRLVAYVVFHPGQAPTPWADLRDHLAAYLPAYMVPVAWVHLDRLPLTANGKLDRRALPAPSAGGEVERGEFAAPRDTLELALTQIWEEVLGVGPVGIGDNFFTLGGHSLLAVVVAARIHERLGQRVPLARLFERPTIATLAPVLREQGGLPWSPLVPLQPRGSSRPLFCVHPVWGRVLCYLDLVHRLPADQPIYGLQARGIDDDQPPHQRIEEMAAYYVTAIRAVQPQGPYRLAGWCFGALVAHEMARQLHEVGQVVDLLALIDTYVEPIGEPAGDVLLARWAAERVPGCRSDWAQLDAQEQLAHVLERARATARLDLVLEYMNNLRALAFYNVQYQARRSYIPGFFPGRAMVFRAQERPAWVPADDAMGWRAVTAEVTVYTVPGSHVTLMTSPHVATVAGHLAAWLAPPTPGGAVPLALPRPPGASIPRNELSPPSGR